MTATVEEYFTLSWITNDYEKESDIQYSIDNVDEAALQVLKENPDVEEVHIYKYAIVMDYHNTIGRDNI
jgi:hypothetical protein